MSRVLPDENIPVGLRRHLANHDVDHVTRLGWEGVANGRLIADAEQAGYHVLVTADQNLCYQQNLPGRRLSLVVLSTNRWNALKRSVAPVISAIDRAEPGSFQEVETDRV